MIKNIHTIERTLLEEVYQATESQNMDLVHKVNCLTSKETPFLQYHGVPIQVTNHFIDSLKSNMRAYLDMMRSYDTVYDDCWDWCICDIGDLTSGYYFESGGVHDKPYFFPENVDVVVRFPDGTII